MAAIAQWPQELYSKQLSGSLSGAALMWFTAENKDKQLEEKAWTDVKTELLERFQPVNFRGELARRTLRKQAPNEDVLEFFDERKHLCNKLNHSEKQIIENIQSAVRPPYWGRINDREWDSLVQLRTKLKKLISLEPVDDAGRPTGGRSSSGEIKASDQQRSDAGTGRTRQALQCFACGRSGHRARECRAPAYSRGGRQNWNSEIGKNSRVDQGSSRPEPYPRINEAFKLTDGGARRMLPPKEGPNHVIAAANKLDNLQSYPPIVLVIDLNGERVLAELDTGASLTVVDATYFREQLMRAQDEIQRRTGLVKLPGGKRAPIYGVTRVTLDYLDRENQAQQITLKAILVENLGCAVLLGRDLVFRTKMLVDAEKRQVFCKAPSMTIEFDPTPVLYEFACEQKFDRKESAGRGIGRANEVDAKPSGAIRLPLTSTSIARLICANQEAGSEGSAQHYQSGRSPDEWETENERASPHESRRITGTGQPKVDEIWGTPYVVPDVAFTDDPSEEKENPYVFKERTRTMRVGEQEIKIGVELRDADEEALQNALKECWHVLAFDGRLGDCDVMMHEIRTADAKPKHVAPYFRSKMEREAVDNQLREWLKLGLIRPSKSPWSSRVVTVRKKDDTMRCCIDYRALNSVTERDVYPLPTSEVIFSSLAHMQVFSSLDLNQGYLQVRVREVDIPKTAFVVQSGFYEFTRMPFGLTNAPATFQRIMDEVLAGLKWEICLVYLDDIIVFGRTLEEHNDNLVKVLKRIESANLTLKPAKCFFAVRELKFLGHIVSSEGVRMDPEKVQAITLCKRPTDVHGVRSFIGMASFYRSFVQNFAMIAEPLTKLTRKDTPFTWTNEQEKAYQILIERLTSKPVMCHFDHEIPVELRTDACGYGLGAILLHRYENNATRVIAYGSRLMQGAELGYGISEKECLAIVWAVEKFKVYLYGVKFTVVTDHLALTWLTTKKELKARLGRWANLLQPYHFTVKYKSGQTHRDADHLSRYPIGHAPVRANRITFGRRGTHQVERSASPESEDEVESLPPKIDLDKIRIAQREDAYCKEILDNLDAEKEYEVENGILVLIDRRDERADSVAKPVIPDQVFNEVLYALHDDPTAGHGGGRRTLWRFKQRYHARNATSRVKEYVRTCHLCQSRKPGWTRKYGMLNPLAPARRPFERMGIDTLGPFRKSKSGNVKIIVATDYFSRFAMAKAVVRENSVEIAEMILDEVVLRHGPPEVILSDRGKSFATELIRQMYSELGIKHVTTTAYHPQTNGLTERFNRTLTVMISMYVGEHHDNWDDFLPYIVFAYNTTVQASTGFSPHYLLYGSEARLPSDVGDPNPALGVAEHFERLHTARERAVEATERAQRGQKIHYDKGRYNQSFQPGAKVMVNHERGYIGKTTKLLHPWVGPYEVVAVHSDLNYKVRDISGNTKKPREETVHVTRLKPYHMRRSEQQPREPTS